MHGVSISSDCCTTDSGADIEELIDWLYIYFCTGRWGGGYLMIWSSGLGCLN